MPGSGRRCPAGRCRSELQCVSIEQVRAAKGMKWGNGERAQRWEEQNDALRGPPPLRPPRPPPRQRRGGPARAPNGAGRRDALVVSHGGCGDGRCGATAAVLGDGICGATAATLLLSHVGQRLAVGAGKWTPIIVMGFPCTLVGNLLELDTIVFPAPLITLRSVVAVVLSPAAA